MSDELKEAWSKVGRAMGRIKSEKKARASRRNGKLGGYPAGRPRAVHLPYLAAPGEAVEYLITQDGRLSKHGRARELSVQDRTRLLYMVETGELERAGKLAHELYYAGTSGPRSRRQS